MPDDTQSPSWTLYRLFDSTDCLLYVGATCDLERRLREHRYRQPWWNQVARVESEERPSKAEALYGERYAIGREAPIFNVKGIVTDLDAKDRWRWRRLKEAVKLFPKPPPTPEQRAEENRKLNIMMNEIMRQGATWGTE